MAINEIELKKEKKILSKVKTLLDDTLNSLGVTVSSGEEDLLEFKNQVTQCLRPSDGGRVFDIHSHFLHGT